RTKHLDIYYHYVKERVCDSYLTVEHVHTTAMAADSLTKPLNRVAHERFLCQISL
ncbi:poly protein, partial [Didymella exigua CBS 183.55]